MSATETPLRIFISYRRDDSQGFAGRIYDRLSGRFGADSVFRDINDIEPGRPWAEAIDQALGSCDVFVLLIGRGWLRAVDHEGHRRLDDAQDRHRREIETALNRDIRTFVVLMEDTPMPDREELPKAAAGQPPDGGTTAKGLQALPDLQGIVIADFAFDYGIDRLIRSIETAAAHESAEAAAREGETAPVREREEPRRPPPEERRPKRRPWILAAIVLAAAVIVGAFLVLSSGGDGQAEAEVAGVVQLGQHPTGLAAVATSDNVWVTDRDDGTISMIDATPDSEEVNQGFASTGCKGADGVAVDDKGFVWVACHGGGGEVWKLNPDSGERGSPIPVGGSPTGIAFGDGFVWVALGARDEVWGLDPETGDAEYKVRVEGDQPYGIDVDDAGIVWVTNRESGSVSQIKPQRTEDPVITESELGEEANPKGIFATEDAVWVAGTDVGRVFKIDPADPNNPEEIPVGSLPRDVVYAFDSIWVSLGGENKVARLDPESGEVEDEITIDASDSEGITAGQSSVWVANGDAGTVTRISP